MRVARLGNWAARYGCTIGTIKRNHLDDDKSSSIISINSHANFERRSIWAKGYLRLLQWIPSCSLRFACFKGAGKPLDLYEGRKSGQRWISAFFGYLFAVASLLVCL